MGALGTKKFSLIVLLVIVFDQVSKQAVLNSFERGDIAD